MKLIVLIAFLAFLQLAYAQEGFDQIKSWRERLQFNEDYDRLQELIKQVDYIIAYLDTEQGQNLTPKQYDELLHEINAIEQEIQTITASYKEEDL